jgi:hypothetical protein
MMHGPIYDAICCLRFCSGGISCVAEVGCVGPGRVGDDRKSGLGEAVERRGLPRYWPFGPEALISICNKKLSHARVISSSIVLTTRLKITGRGQRAEQPSSTHEGHEAPAPHHLLSTLLQPILLHESSRDMQRETRPYTCMSWHSHR